ncbi:GNAT family N-acetyltransferase [Paenibacillus sp. JDR-2]|uniref:GNAT family N-acetyltransferase n=1 Tax=Paenibacillus sp. (strain JDR-2) TaxID=324057 RepID=UPI000166798C|nr:GNAT family N-acetyltransferase [Paenibacillus sp. JDR-2]ACT01170.1 GCN5-related N-acetyltransferase [Paenibacillus sp. JDR-2]
MEIRSIDESEIDLFIEVLTEGARWIAANKNRMWDESDLHVQSLMDGLTINHFYAAFMDGEIAAVMILQDEDSFFWPEDQEGEALYLHKLCIRRKHAKTGLSGSMIRYAKSFAEVSRKKFLKLDCAADRAALRQFYEQHGFTLVGERLAMEMYPAAFYQYEIKSYAKT